MASLRAEIEEYPSPSLSPLTDPAVSPEIYRQIYVSLDLPSDGQSVVGLTSAIRGEGRTTIALGLASSLAGDLDSQVVLVEADLDNPSLAQHFGLPETPGLADVIRGHALLQDVSHAVSENLLVVVAGFIGTDTPRLLRRLALDNPFRSNTPGRSIVIVDLPPLMAHSYAPFAARVADTLLVVVRAGVTPSDVVREAIVRLESASLRGVILNGQCSSLPLWWPGSVV